MRVLKPKGQEWMSLPRFTYRGSRQGEVTTSANSTVRYILLNSLVFHLWAWQFPYLGKSYESLQTERGTMRALAQYVLGEIEIARAWYFVVTARVR